MCTLKKCYTFRTIHNAIVTVNMEMEAIIICKLCILLATMRAWIFITVLLRNQGNMRHVENYFATVALNNIRNVVKPAHPVERKKQNTSKTAEVRYKIIP